jgi:glycolate oxidase iron-sulfur subunit
VLIEQELLSDCIHCGFCLPTCPTYGPLWQEEMDSPRGRIYLMQGLLDGTVPLTATTVEHFDRCTGCMACVTACPSGVQYDKLIEQTRAEIEDRFERTLGDRALRALVFALFPHPSRLRLALSLRPRRLPGRLQPFAELAPPREWVTREKVARRTPAAGKTVARVGLLLGCVQRLLFAGVNAATARVLAADGCEVLAPGQACCGALHLHSGRRDEGYARAGKLGRIFQQAGVDTLVVNAAGCGSHLKEAELGVRVLDVSELLAELGARAERRPLPLAVAFQDSCHLAHAQRVRVEPREALLAIPELELREPAEQAICCGSAGIYNLVQPQAASELGERKARHVAATGADVYASANPGCLIQVAAALRRAGRPLPALHPIELVDASIRAVPAPTLVATARR